MTGRRRDGRDRSGHRARSRRRWRARSPSSTPRSRRHRPDPADPIGVLAAVGGLEIGASSASSLGAAAARIPVVLDGFITGAAALLAARLAPDLPARLLAGHRSVEPGHAVVLEHLGLRAAARPRPAARGGDRRRPGDGPGRRRGPPPRRDGDVRLGRRVAGRPDGRRADDRARPPRLDGVVRQALRGPQRSVARPGRGGRRGRARPRPRRASSGPAAGSCRARCGARSRRPRPSPPRPAPRSPSTGAGRRPTSGRSRA